VFAPTRWSRPHSICRFPDAQLSAEHGICRLSRHRAVLGAGGAIVETRSSRLRSGSSSWLAPHGHAAPVLVSVAVDVPSPHAKATRPERCSTATVDESGEREASGEGPMIPDAVWLFLHDVGDSGRLHRAAGARLLRQCDRNGAIRRPEPLQQAVVRARRSAQPLGLRAHGRAAVVALRRPSRRSASVPTVAGSCSPRAYSAVPAATTALTAARPRDRAWEAACIRPPTHRWQ
jgi:hypothetical protein